MTAESKRATERLQPSFQLCLVLVSISSSGCECVGVGMCGCMCESVCVCVSQRTAMEHSSNRCPVYKCEIKGFHFLRRLEINRVGFLKIR